MLTAMELSRTKSLLAHVSGFLALTFAAGMVLTPALPSQTAKELIGDACYNELQQREKRTLSSYVAESHSNDHVFREQVIETVEVPVRHLLAVDGNPPTSVQLKEENDRHQELLKNASRRHAIWKQQDNDDKVMAQLLSIIPEAFVFEDLGKEGQSERIAFHPNPEFKPKTYEQRILHSLDGIFFLDLQEKRIAPLSGSLGTRLRFRHYMLAHTHRSVPTEITRVPL